MDFPPSILAESDSNDSISPTDDYAYAEALQLQEILMSTLSKLTTTEASTSSCQQTISCEICTEDISKSDMFEIEGSVHSFCLKCVPTDIEYKLKENIVSSSCPDRDCDNTIKPGSVKSIVPKEVLERWEEEIARLAIPEYEKIYCPYENCSKLFINFLDDDGNVITQTNCPHCGKSLCAVCKVPWHLGFDCEEYKSLEHNNKEEEELRSWARKKKAMECPNCNELVENDEGCIHMTCRCKSEFCYTCGAVWDETNWDTCLEEK